MMMMKINNHYINYLKKNKKKNIIIKYIQDSVETSNQNKEINHNYQLQPSIISIYS